MSCVYGDFVGFTNPLYNYLGASGFFFGVGLVPFGNGGQLPFLSFFTQLSFPTGLPASALVTAGVAIAGLVSAAVATVIKPIDKNKTLSNFICSPVNRW
jgi:hypothetical protein